jgi:hypothetical protein
MYSCFSLYFCSLRAITFFILLKKKNDALFDFKTKIFQTTDRRTIPFDAVELVYVTSLPSKAPEPSYSYQLMLDTKDNASIVVAKSDSSDGFLPIVTFIHERTDIPFHDTIIPA